jgi:signal transduction histidine kinase/CheY-like chemotaxis protein/HPt (histidine-containing phosphotransfer) domain-containing protein
MPRISLPVKIGFLMTLAMLIIAASGYLSFRSLSSIVSSIRVKSEPDERLLLIREITNDIDKAENSVRLFVHTHKKKDIDPYYKAISGFDAKIERLKRSSVADTLLLSQVDTIGNLLEENIINWNKMLELYHDDSVDNYMRNLTTQLTQASSQNNKPREGSILKRVFGKKPKPTPIDQEKIIHDLNAIERQDSLKTTRIMAAEAQLASTGNEIRERFYLVISKMEQEIILSVKNNASAADRLARQTYNWLALFVVSGCLLVMIVVLTVVSYVRKAREYEKALIRSKQETEKLAKTKELFMANMSHEIRTPVNAIYGFTEQLSYHPVDEKSRHMLQIIKASSDHLVRLVNEILDFSKLEAGKIQLEPQHFLISQVCEEVQLLYAGKAAEKNTNLKYFIGPEVPRTVYGDAYRLRQILFNLVGNSVKFTTAGEICFTLQAEDVQLPHFNLVITVADTGIGIIKEMQDKVFEDFTQEDGKTAGKYGGTGLGLSIVKKLAALHGGSISLESEKNKGTLITCILPYREGNPEAVPRQEEKLQVPGWINSLKILIVDDEAYNRLLFKTILNRWQVEYEEAENGQQAIDLLNKDLYDLVFMDVRMPGMDGLTATRIIRSDSMNKNTSVPIIGISATNTSEDKAIFAREGMNAFLSKPFTEKMLLDCILSVVSRPAKTIDLTSLYHLANNDQPFIRSMLVSFIENTEKGISEMEAAINESNIAEASDIAHKISSPCIHIGAKMLYDRLKMIEKHDGHNPETLRKLCDETKKEFLSVKETLETHILKMSEL